MSKKRNQPTRYNSGGIGPYKGKVRIERTLIEHVKVGTRTVRKRILKTSNGEIKSKKESHHWDFLPEEVQQLTASWNRTPQGALGYSDSNNQEDANYYLDEDEN